MYPKVSGVIPVCLLLFASDAAAQDAVELAARLIGRPYVWGAEGPREFDCSGLTQYVYEQVGVDLPRQAIQQSKAGDAAGRRLKRGDLLFFSTDTRRALVTHVGLYEGNGVMIDASKRHGRVRRDELSDQYWVERFMFARRVARSSTLPDRSRQGDKDLRRQPAIQVLKGVADILLERRRR